MSSDFILGPQIPIGTSWFDTTQVERAKVHGRAFPATPPTDVDPYIMAHYYDLGLSLRITYERTKDPEFLTLFQKAEDSWWKMPWISEGHTRSWPDSISPDPRHAGVLGLILRAIDRPEMWDWINSYTRFHLDHWLIKRLASPALFYGVRPGAFTLRYAAALAKVLPDTFPLQAGGSVTNGAQLRAQYLADVEKISVEYYGRLQQSDGSWRWDDWDYTDPIDKGTLKGVMQPFMVGLLLNALVDVHRLTGNLTVKENVKNQIVKACRHLYVDGPYSRQRLAALGVDLRGFHYFYHGGTTVNPTKYAKGDLPVDWNPTDKSDVQNQRQAIGLLVAPFAYAFQITGDSLFKAAADELWDSAYGETDKIRNYMAGDAKSYNQNCGAGRASSYLAWIGKTTSTPTPTPSPTPFPVPLYETSRFVWPSKMADRDALWKKVGAEGWNCFAHDGFLYCSRQK